MSFILLLQVSHEGTTKVKRARKKTLIQEYEMFRMLSRKSISDVQNHFTHVLSHLLALGKNFVLEIRESTTWNNLRLKLEAQRKV